MSHYRGLSGDILNHIIMINQFSNVCAWFTFHEGIRHKGTFKTPGSQQFIITVVTSTNPTLREVCTLVQGAALICIAMLDVVDRQRFVGRIQTTVCSPRDFVTVKIVLFHAFKTSFSLYGYFLLEPRSQ